MYLSVPVCLNKDGATIVPRCISARPTGTLIPHGIAAKAIYTLTPWRIIAGIACTLIYDVYHRKDLGRTLCNIENTIMCNIENTICT